MNTSIISRAARVVILVTVTAWPLQAQSDVRALVGTWQLVSRTDSGPSGIRPADGPLGSDPIALLIYDSAGNVSAQLMARDRTTTTVAPRSLPDPNNSSSQGGYDAYFGRYEVDTARHLVIHRLAAALSPGDVNRQLTRQYRVQGDTLVLEFQVRRENGEMVQRRLRWLRIAP